MLLGDTDVEQPVGKPVAECGQPRRPRHGGGDRDDVAALACVLDQRIGKRGRPAGSGHLRRQTRVRVDDARRVHLLGFVVLGGPVAHALASDDVNDHGCVVATRVAQRHLDGVLVVAVDRPDVFEAEVGEHHLRGERVLQAGLHAVHALVAELADDRHAPHRAAAPLQDLLVAGLQPQRREVIGEPTDGGRVAAAVVVDDDHDGAPGCGDVVQCFPAHAAGERTVSDDRDHVPVAVAGQLERLGESVGVGQCGAGVAGLDPVMVALVARRVARETVLLAQGVELVAPAGQHLVYVGLMAGVEDDRIVRRVEHPVQRQRELDDTEVGAEMSTGCSDLMDQKLSDLVSKFS